MLILDNEQKFFHLMDKWWENKPKNNSTIDPNDLMTQRQAMKFLGKSMPTIIRWRNSGKLPYYKQNRTIFYKKSELLMAMRKEAK